MSAAGSEPPAGGLSRGDYLRRWSTLHEGIDPAGVPFVRGWLTIAYVAGRPLARVGVSPSAITVFGVVVAWAAVPVVALGGRWPIVATVLVVLSGLLDNLDGTVAVLTDRVSARGALVDAVADRVADTAYGVALWVLGAPGWLAALWVSLGWLAEYARVRGHVLLGSHIDVVTIGERPTRIVLTAFALAGCAILPSHADVVATACAIAAAGTAAVGLLQMLWALYRRLG